MTDLTVRRPRFDFTDDVPFIWNPANPAFSFFMNATSMIAICFEQMIVAAVQEAKPRILDPAIAQEANAFLRQEAQHSSSHRKHVNALIKHYPGLQETLDAAIASFDTVTATTPLDYRLAYIADLEATFTPSFKLILDNEDTLFATGDDRVASLFLWHFVEEVEHRSSALVIYHAVGGSDWYRMKVLPRVLRHLIAVANVIVDGVNAHVPLADRLVDARTFLPAFRIREGVRRTVTFGRAGSADGVPPAFSTVSWREKLVAGGRVLLSQTPSHNPDHEPLPEFADRWFDRYDRGGDVTRWYGEQRVGG
jgi:predicted metal-dependent hydrolase